MEWTLIKAVIGLLCALTGLYHWLKLEKNGNAAYHAGNAVMYTIVAYNLFDGLAAN